MNSSEILVEDLTWGGWGMDITKSAVPDDHTFVSSLKFALQGMGENFSKIYLAGISGACFYIGWNSKTLHSGMGGATYTFPKVGLKVDTFKNLSLGIGRECKVIQKYQISKMWEIIKKSIDEKHPVVACEWNPVPHRGHYSIIYGYEADKKIYLKSYGEEGKYISKPENLQYIIYFGTPIDKIPSKKKIAFNSIKLGIDLLDLGVIEDEETAGYGIDAYEFQRDLILNTLAPQKSYYPLWIHWLTWRNTVTWLSRNYAYQFLFEIKEFFENPMKRHIEKACDYYLAYHKKWQKFYEACRNASDYEVFLKNFLSDSTNRKKYGNFLEDLRKIEIDALNELKLVLVNITSSN